MPYAAPRKVAGTVRATVARALRTCFASMRRRPPSVSTHRPPISCALQFYVPVEYDDDDDDDNDDDDDDGPAITML